LCKQRLPLVSPDLSKRRKNVPGAQQTEKEFGGKHNTYGHREERGVFERIGRRTYRALTPTPLFRGAGIEDREGRERNAVV